MELHYSSNGKMFSAAWRAGSHLDRQPACAESCPRHAPLQKKKFAPSKFVFLLDRKKQVFCDSKKSLSETKFLFETVSNPFAASTRVGFWGRGAAQKNHKHRNGASCKLHDDDDDKTVRITTGGILVEEEPLRMNFYICRFTARVWVKISGMKTQIILTLRPHIAFCWDERHCGLAWWWPWGNWRTERLRRRFRPRGTERGEKETHISLSLSLDRARTHASTHPQTLSLFLRHEHNEKLTHWCTITCNQPSSPLYERITSASAAQPAPPRLPRTALTNMQCARIVVVPFKNPP